ncbi:MAG: hypothetical protein CMH30_09350 [Micavibrio sp.]|nr:hypothetical protein [Micavibrio sp.]|tara:strand:- start:2859 stop:3128 length:270 start_codon:yes stop_codon:yes gene_type:complete
MDLVQAFTLADIAKAIVPAVAGMVAFYCAFKKDLSNIYEAVLVKTNGNKAKAAVAVGRNVAPVFVTSLGAVAIGAGVPYMAVDLNLFPS